MKRNMIDLQMFSDPEPKPADPPAPTTEPKPTEPQIDYDKLAQIVAGKQSAAEDSVLRGYFRQQGLSKEDMDAAVAAFKENQRKNDPARKVIELQEKVQRYEQEKVLAAKHVKPDDFDYVLFKASKMVDDKTPFDKAVENFLKENPRFSSETQPYRVSTGVQSGGTPESKTVNEQVNSVIRKAFGRE